MTNDSLEVRWLEGDEAAAALLAAGMTAAELRAFATEALAKRLKETFAELPSNVIRRGVVEASGRLEEPFPCATGSKAPRSQTS